MISMITPEYTPIPARPEQLQALSRELMQVGERLENVNGADWQIVAKAAALLDGQRIDMLEVPHVRS